MNCFLPLKQHERTLKDVKILYRGTWLGITFKARSRLQLQLDPITDSKDIQHLCVSVDGNNNKYCNVR